MRKPGYKGRDKLIAIFKGLRRLDRQGDASIKTACLLIKYVNGLVYGLNVLDREMTAKTQKDVQRLMYLVFRAHDLLGQYTPEQFRQFYPIGKDYDGEHYQSKDYYSTLKYLKEYVSDKPIGKKNVPEFLYDYFNEEILEFCVATLMIMSRIRQFEFKPSLAEEFLSMLEKPSKPKLTLVKG